MLRRMFLSLLTGSGFLLTGGKGAAALEAASQSDLAGQGYAVFSADESWLGLKILGYQFPDETHDPYDSNWLMISGHVGIKGQSWTFTDPCLLTTEVESLADWLVAVASSNTASQDCGFIEPNLDFKRIAPDNICISFLLESRPPWAERDDFETEYGFEMPVTSALLTVADNLHHQLETFPKRG
jgi:hypothetical protein